MQTVTDWTIELYTCRVANLLSLIMLHCVPQIPLTTQMNTCGSCRQGRPAFLESGLWVYARLLTRGKVFSLCLSLSVQLWSPLHKHWRDPQSPGSILSPEANTHQAPNTVSIYFGSLKRQWRQSSSGNIYKLELMERQLMKSESLTAWEFQVDICSVLMPQGSNGSSQSSKAT